VSLASEHFRDEPRILSAAANNPPLKFGEVGSAVARLQQALLDLKYALPVSTKKTGSADGIYGSETKSVVKKFQSDEGLSKDGVAGAKTLARLDTLLVERRVPYKPVEPEDGDPTLRFRIIGTPPPAALPPWVSWDPADYRAAVRHQINKKLLRSQTGRSVIAAIARSVQIRPGKHARDPSAFWQPAEGTLYYTPGNFIPGSKLYASSPYLIGYTADAILLHELAHAMRSTRGFWGKDQVPIGAIHYPPWSAEGNPTHYLYFGKRGEFNAIVISNIYLSEMTPDGSISGTARNRILLVKDHHLGHAHIPLTAPEYFHRQPTIRHYLQMLWNDQPALCEGIAAAGAEFNPIRDFRARV
jgi:hypothetical protein